MSTRLRMIAPHPLGSRGQRRYSPVVYWCCVLAVCLQLIFSSNVLDNMGLEGMGKVHPSTIILILCTAYALATGIIPFGRHLRESPALTLYLIGIPALMAYSVLFVGISGATVFIETFWSAGLLALLLGPASARQKRLLGMILMALVLLNIAVAIYESLTVKELFPIVYDPDQVKYLDNTAPEEFRAHAFFTHPLTASLITAMAFFLLYTMRPRFLVGAPLFLALLVGLLAYGGRTALGVTLIMSAGLAFWVLITGLLRRNLRLDFIVMMVIAAIVVPIVVAILVSQTSIGDRIMDNLYYDGSAQARVTQWAVFEHLNMQDWLFGTSKDRLAVLKYQIGLGGKQTDIENFWILTLLDLGVIGFAAFLAVFLGFLNHLARVSGTLTGCLLVISALIIDSTSNSLGVWSNDLMIEVAFVMAIAGYRGYLPVRVVPRRLWALPMHRPATIRGNLAVTPGRLRSPGLQAAITSRQ